MKPVYPDPSQAEVIVRAMLAVVSAEGRMAPSRLEAESIVAIQRHVLGLSEPLMEVPPGPLPPERDYALWSDDLRRVTLRMLALLPLIDRCIQPAKADVVATAAVRLGIKEPSLDILHHASRNHYRWVALALMRRFVSAFWSPTGKTRLRDYAQFAWWMMPSLHGKRTAARHRALTEQFRTLRALPDGTLGREVFRFHEDNGIPLPGQPGSVPWSMHEVYHVIGEYGLAFHPELVLTAFIGGNQDETCLDQLLFGLLAHHVGKQIIGGHVTQGLLEPEPYFRALGRGMAMRQNLLKDWTLWDDAATPVPDVRRKFNVAPFTEAELTDMASKGELLTGAGYTLAAPTRPLVPEPDSAQAAVLRPGSVSRIWAEASLRKSVAREPGATLRTLGVPVPEDVSVIAVTSWSRPADREPTLYQFVFEHADQIAYACLPAPHAPAAQQTAYGGIVSTSADDPAFEARFRADLAAALARLRPDRGESAVGDAGIEQTDNIGNRIATG
jgi:hypothetical protein